MPDQPPPTQQSRIVPRRRSERIRRTGLGARWHSDLYHRTLTLRWWWFLPLGALVYVASNAAFAVLYLLQPGSIDGAREGSFADAFFFSVQCINTIGFGHMLPATLYANVLVMLEAMAGVVLTALATGLVFARISRPTARVMFARNGVIGRHNGVETLTFRLANERASQILEADVTVTLLRSERTAEGAVFRRFHNLHLLRSRTPVFALTFSVMHPIDPASPLFPPGHALPEGSDAEFLITVTGLEETTSQTVHARYSYRPEEILPHRRFSDIFIDRAEGWREIDYRRFHDTEPE